MLSADCAELAQPVVGRAVPRHERASPPRTGDDGTRTIPRAAAARTDVTPADHLRMPLSDVASSDRARREHQLFATAARARCSERALEEERVALLGEVYAAGLDLARQLRDHTLHSMAEYRGSHSAWDVLAESEVLATAQERYATVARRASARLPSILAAAQPPR